MSLFQTNEANDEMAKAPTEQPPVSVADSRMKYPSVDCSSGKAKSELVSI